MWQKAVAEEFGQQSERKLRFSGAGRCVRAQAYAAMGVPETDPPDETSRNRMFLGHAAEILIVMDLEAQGWETAHTVLSESGQLELSLTLPESGAVVTGHPDGICRHPQLTKNIWVTLECKSMSPSRAEETVRQGIARAYPAYISQIALYGQELHRLELVGHPRRGVFAMMDREGCPLAPERVSWTEDDARSALAALERAALAARDGELPERPHEAGSPECNFCNHHTGCWGNPPKEAVIDTQDWRRRIPPTAELEAAARTWKELNPVLQEAKRTLQAAVDANGGGTLEAEGVLASYFIPRNDAKYDQGRLERTVPQDLLRQCLKGAGTVNRNAFWVRADRRVQENQGESNEQDRVD